MLAFLAAKQSHAINVMKGIKLMYLADRESMRKYGEPISHDHMVAMNNGPVLSQTLNLINGDVAPAVAAEWDSWITDRENHNISVSREFSRADLDELSNADLEILSAVWSEFGHLNQWQLSEYTHEHCPEWRHPNGSCLPIDQAALLRQLGWAPSQAESGAQRIKIGHELDSVFARL